MLKKRESGSIVRYSHVIFFFSVVINYSLLYGCSKASGEPAATVNATTANTPEIRHDYETVKLIIVTDYQIFMQGPTFFFEPEESDNFIYNSTDTITGIGIHVSKKLLFITDETHNIYKATLNNVEMSPSILSRVLIYSTGNTNQIPVMLSVDWLNDKLYILFEAFESNSVAWQISRCDLDGSQLQVVYSGLQLKPVHVEVDPFNGYLFWSLSGQSKNDDGLFRLDLNDMPNGVKHEIVPMLILKHDKVGVFAIDYIHYKILVPIESLNTVISMDLNGESNEIIRKNIKSPTSSTVKSIAIANGQFYWISSDGQLMEEFHIMAKYYYDNRFSDFAMLNNFLFVCVNLPSAQPIPKPLNPPRNVKARFGVDQAKVSWQTPHLLDIQGRGAWQDWTYELEIIDEENSDTKRIINLIKALNFTATDLIPGTKYCFRIAAYTGAGYSPYSVKFCGQTLEPHGFIQSDIMYKNMNPIVNCPFPHKFIDGKHQLSVYDSTDRTIWLRLPVPKKLRNCPTEPMNLKYQLMYTEINNDDIQFCLPSTCTTVETREKIIEIGHLKPYTKYQFQLRFSILDTKNLDMKTKFTKVQTFRTRLPDPDVIKLVSSTSKSLTIQWESYPRDTKYLMLCRPIHSKDFISEEAEVILDSTTNVMFSPSNLVTISNLHPNTRYSFWLSFWFEDRIDPYFWPVDERFTFKTDPSTSSIIDQPNAKGEIIPSNNVVYQVIAFVTSSVIVAAFIIALFYCIIKRKMNDEQIVTQVEEYTPERDDETSVEYEEIEIDQVNPSEIPTTTL